MGVAHDRLHVADRAEKVAAVDREPAAEADDEVLREVRHPDHLMGHDLADRHDEIPAVEQQLVHLDRNRLRHPARREGGDLLATDLTDPHQPFPPAMLEDPVEGNAVSEEQLRFAWRHRGVRAERGQHGNLATGGGQPFEQQARDLSGARVQPREVGRNEQHPPRTRGEYLGRRELLDDPSQLVARDARSGPPTLRSGGVAVPARRTASAASARSTTAAALAARIDRHDIGLLTAPGLQRLELAVDHRGVHEMVGPLGDTPDGLVSIHDEVEEAHVSRAA